MHHVDYIFDFPFEVFVFVLPASLGDPLDGVESRLGDSMTRHFFQFSIQRGFDVRFEVEL
jgi:hypothetical protein